MLAIGFAALATAPTTWSASKIDSNRTIASIILAIALAVLGWRWWVRRRSRPAIRSFRVGRRVAMVLAWFFVGTIAAGVAGNVLYGSANVLAYVIGAVVGLGAYVVLLVRDRRRAAGHRQST